MHGAKNENELKKKKQNPFAVGGVKVHSQMVFGRSQSKHRITKLFRIETKQPMRTVCVCVSGFFGVSRQRLEFESKREIPSIVVLKWNKAEEKKKEIKQKRTKKETKVN